MPPGGHEGRARPGVGSAGPAVHAPGVAQQDRLAEVGDISGQRPKVGVVAAGGHGPRGRPPAEGDHRGPAGGQVGRGQVPDGRAPGHEAVADAQLAADRRLQPAVGRLLGGGGGGGGGAGAGAEQGRGRGRGGGPVEGPGREGERAEQGEHQGDRDGGSAPGPGAGGYGVAGTASGAGGDGVAGTASGTHAIASEAPSGETAPCSAVAGPVGARPAWGSRSGRYGGNDGWEGHRGTG